MRETSIGDIVCRADTQLDIVQPPVQLTTMAQCNYLIAQRQQVHLECINAQSRVWDPRYKQKRLQNSIASHVIARHSPHSRIGVKGVTASQIPSHVRSANVIVRSSRIEWENKHRNCAWKDWIDTIVLALIARWNRYPRHYNQRNWHFGPHNARILCFTI